MPARRHSQWDEFKETALRLKTYELYASLTPQGAFVFNMKTYRKMHEPEAVVLLYDRDARTIGIRPSRIEVPNAIQVRIRCTRTSRVVRSRRFLTKHGIVLEKTIQFPTAQINAEGVLILNLREAIAATDLIRRSKK